MDQEGLVLGVRQKIYPSSPMAHTANSDLLTTAVQLLIEQGSDGFAEGIRHLVNEAMARERSAALSADPACAPRGLPRPRPRLQGQRPSPPAWVASPSVSHRSAVACGSSILDKGICSKQALKVALAGMYVQGVSTRKVAAIVEQLCGTSVSSARFSACA